MVSSEETIETAELDGPANHRPEGRC